MGVTEHLKPHQWQKGQSGNPSGRPAQKPLSALLRVAGENGAYQQIVTALIERARQGDTRAITIILDRVEGRVSDHMILEASGLDLDSLLRRKAGADDDSDADSADSGQPCGSPDDQAGS
jgi:hypothetical protein